MPLRKARNELENKMRAKASSARRTTSKTRVTSQMVPEDQLIFSAAELSKRLGSRTAISRLVERKKLQTLGSGYYAIPHISKFEATVLVVGRYFPKAILSGKTALKIHGLLHDDLEIVDADLERTTSQKNRLIRFTRVHKSRLTGIVQTNRRGLDIRVYDLERTLAEAALRGFSGEVLDDVLRKYVEKQQVNLNKVRHYDKEFGLKLAPQIEQIVTSDSYLTKEGGSRRVPQAKHQTGLQEKPKFSLRERVTQAALLVFTRSGSAGLTVSRVAEEVGVDEELILKLFGTKRDLIESVYHSILLANDSNEVTPPQHTGSPEDVVRQIAEATFTMIDSDPIIQKLQAWFVAERSEVGDKLVQKTCTEMVRAIKIQIQTGVSGISALEAEARALLFTANLDQYCTVYHYYLDRISTEARRSDIARAYKDIILKVYLPALFQPPGQISSKRG